MGHYFINDENLKSEIKKTQIKIKDKTYTFFTDNGVFAKRGLDFGTHTLLKTLSPLQMQGEVLDLGCGYGPIGIFLKDSNKELIIDMIDINLRSLKLAHMNALENAVDVNIFKSNGYELVTKKYDYIVSNPPIRVGKKKLYELLIKAKEHLRINGELWIVIHKDQGAKTIAKELSKYYQVEIENKDKGFFIIKAKLIDSLQELC